MNTTHEYNLCSTTKIWLHKICFQKMGVHVVQSFVWI